MVCSFCVSGKRKTETQDEIMEIQIFGQFESGQVGSYGLWWTKVRNYQKNSTHGGPVRVCKSL